MAKQKAVSRPAAQPAVKKKWSGHKTEAKSSARKTIKSKARGVSAAKAKPAKKPRPERKPAPQKTGFEHQQCTVQDPCSTRNTW